MKWILSNSGPNTSAYEMVREDGSKIVFKYSHSQQSIRMRYNDHYGVYVLDEGGLAGKKIAIRNVYGSEIGMVTKNLLRTTSGSVFFNDSPEIINYVISADQSLIEINGDTSISIAITGSIAESTYELHLLTSIVFSWMRFAASDKLATSY